MIIAITDGTLWAVEIKRSLAAKLERGFHQACEDLNPAKAFVVHAGPDRFPVAKGIEAVGLREMAALLGGS